jgi:hypothetical protein
LTGVRSVALQQPARALGFVMTDFAYIISDRKSVV